MRRYFDTAVLLKIYVHEENSDNAIALIRSVLPPLPFSHLHRLEMTNAIYLKAGRKEITSTQARTALSLLRSDLEAGFMVPPDYDLAGSFHYAEELAERYAAKTLARSLDILHVAMALGVGCTEFVSFDRRQRTLAKGLGLKVLPRMTV